MCVQIRDAQRMEEHLGRGRGRVESVSETHYCLPEEGV